MPNKSTKLLGQINNLEINYYIFINNVVKEEMFIKYTLFAFSVYGWVTVRESYERADEYKLRQDSRGTVKGTLTQGLRIHKVRSAVYVTDY